MVLRLAYFLEILNSPYGNHLTLDSQIHHEWATRIADGEGDSHGAFFRAPLYPYLLGTVYTLFGPSQSAAKLAQILISVGTCWLVYLLGRRVFGDTIAMVSLALSAFYGMFFYFADELLIVTLIVAFDLLGLILLLWARGSPHPLAWLPAGLVFGLSAIARPNILIFVAIVPLWMVAVYWKSESRLRLLPRILAFGFGCILPIVPVTMHNVMTEGELVLIASQGGVNFYIGNNAESDGITAIVPGTRKTWWGGYDDQVRIAKEALGDPTASAAAISRYWYGRAWDWILDHPKDAASHTLYKARVLFNAQEVGNNRVISFVTRFSRVFTYLGVRFWMILPLAVMGIWLSVRQRRDVSLLLLFVVAYAGSIVPFFVCSRFRMPLVPVFIVFAAFALVEVVRAVRERPSRIAVRQLAVGAVLAVLTLLATLPAPSLANTSAQGHFNEAEAYREKGAIPDAVISYQRAIDELPCFPEAQLNLAKAYLELMGDPDRAWRTIAGALDACGEERDLLYRAGVMQIDLGRPEPGREYLHRAEAVAGTDPDIDLAMAVAAETLGEREEALERYRRVLAVQPAFEPALAGARRLEARGPTADREPQSPR